jgi:hypothetical protein
VFHLRYFYARSEFFFCLHLIISRWFRLRDQRHMKNSLRASKIASGKIGLKAVFHLAKFFDRIEIFFCLTSTQMELIRNLLNLSYRNLRFTSVHMWPKYRASKTKLTPLLFKLAAKVSVFFTHPVHRRVLSV